jgi:hypothetical protein
VSDGDMTQTDARCWWGVAGIENLIGCIVGLVLNTVVGAVMSRSDITFWEKFGAEDWLINGVCFWKPSSYKSGSTSGSSPRQNQVDIR